MARVFAILPAVLLLTSTEAVLTGASLVVHSTIYPLPAPELPSGITREYLSLAQQRLGVDLGCKPFGKHADCSARGFC